MARGDKPFLGYWKGRSVGQLVTLRRGDRLPRWHYTTYMVIILELRWAGLSVDSPHGIPRPALDTRRDAEVRVMSRVTAAIHYIDCSGPRPSPTRARLEVEERAWNLEAHRGAQFKVVTSG